jgi:predicted exporter
MGQLAAISLEQDPSLLFKRYFTALNPVTFSLKDGIPLSQDHDYFWALLLTELKDNRLELDKLETLLALVQKAKQEITSAGGDLLATGMPLFTAAGADSAKKEISTIGFGSSAGILALMLMTFRSARPLLLSFTAIGSGLAAGLVVSILAFGKIHIITLVFGASLIGVADDYALHYFCDSVGVKNWQPARALHYIFPGLVFGLIANLLSYAGLMLSPFPGLREVALFSATGLLFSWLTVVLLFPFCLHRFNSRHRPALLIVADYWQSHWPAWLIKNRRWLAFLTIFMIGGGIWQLAPRDDVRLLQSPSADLMEAANKISQLLPYSRENQFFLVSGADMHEWRRNEQNLLDRLDLAVQRRQLKSYQGLSTFWPDEDLQKQNYQLLADGLYHSGKIPAYMNKLGFSADAIAAEAKQFDIARNRLISLPDWLADADESKQSLWLGCEHNQCASIVAISGLKSAAAISGWQNLPGVAWVDPVEDLNSLFARYRIRASLLLVSAFCIVFTGLGFRFGWRNALAITSIPVFAALASLAVSGWFHQMFGLFNLFALLLVLGIGTDDAVFFFMAKRTDSTSISPENNFHDKRATTSLAVTLSALTTLLAFGLLAASSTEVVHAFGCTVASGITAALLCSPLVGYKKA